MNVYLCGGMKSSWQDKVISIVEGINFIDPRSHGLNDEVLYTAWDLDAIRKSNIVFAYMDSDNPSGYGLNLEVGYAKALGIPVWYVCEDTTNRQRYFGMVRACADRVFESLDSAIKELDEVE